MPRHHAGATGARWSKVRREVIAATYAGEAFDVCVGKSLMQEHAVGFVLAIVTLGGRVGVYVYVAVVYLVKDEAHVGATGLCRATVAACEGVCSVVYGREAVALCAGHCGEGEGVAASVHGCKNGVVCGVCRDGTGVVRV